MRPSARNALYRRDRLRIRIARGFWTSRFGIALLVGLLAILLGATSVFAYYYIQFGHLIDERLTGQIFQNTSRVYSAPGRIYAGESLRATDLASYLLRAGYQEGVVAGAPGQFRVTASAVEIRPSADSYFQGQNALRVDFTGSEISHIAQLSDGTQLDAAQIEPEVITNLFDSSREKRRVVRYDDLPPVLVHAVLAAEDKRFFEHGALDMVRVFGAAFYDVSRGQKAQGASTIDMQVARTFFFTTKREWRRKLKEILMAAEIDERFSKQQILELYANDIYMGNRGSFSIRGLRRSCAGLFRQGRARTDPGRSGVPGRNHPRAEPLFGGRAPRRPRRGSARPRARPDGRGWLPDRRTGGRRQEREAALRERRSGQQLRAVFCGHGEGPSARKIFRERSGKPKLPHLHDARSRPRARGHRCRPDRRRRTWTSSSRAATPSGRRRARRFRRCRSPSWCSIRIPAKFARWSAAATMAKAS